MTATRPRAMRDALLERIWQGMAEDERLFFVAADFGAPPWTASGAISLAVSSTWASPNRI